MKNIREFALETKNDKIAFLPGEILRGELYITLEEKAQVRSIKIFLQGEGAGQWLQQSCGDNLQNKQKDGDGKLSRRMLLDIGLRAFGNSSKEDKAPPVHDSGRYVYEFQFRIPDDVPPSFKSPVERDLGFVKYYLKAILSRPRKNDKIARLAIAINELISPDRPELSFLPGSSDSKSVTTNCISTGTIFLESCLSRSYYVQGEKIIINATAENESTKVMKELYAKLVRRVRCKARFGTKTYSTSVASTHSHRIPASGRVQWQNHEFSVHAVGPTINHDDDIRVDYFVRVGMGEDYSTEIHLDLPVVIGTVGTKDEMQKRQEQEAEEEYLAKQQREKFRLKCIKDGERNDYREVINRRVGPFDQIKISEDENFYWINGHDGGPRILFEKARGRGIKKEDLPSKRSQSADVVGNKRTRSKSGDRSFSLDGKRAGKRPASTGATPKSQSHTVSQDAPVKKSGETMKAKDRKVHNVPSGSKDDLDNSKNLLTGQTNVSDTRGRSKVKPSSSGKISPTKASETKLAGKHSTTGIKPFGSKEQINDRRGHPTSGERSRSVDTKSRPKTKGLAAPKAKSRSKSADTEKRNAQYESTEHISDLSTPLTSNKEPSIIKASTKNEGGPGEHNDDDSEESLYVYRGSVHSESNIPLEFSRSFTKGETKKLHGDNDDNALTISLMAYREGREALAKGVPMSKETRQQIINSEKMREDENDADEDGKFSGNDVSRLEENQFSNAKENSISQQNSLIDEPRQKLDTDEELQESNDENLIAEMETGYKIDKLVKRPKSKIDEDAMEIVEINEQEDEAPINFNEHEQQDSINQRKKQVAKQSQPSKQDIEAHDQDKEATYDAIRLPTADHATESANNTEEKRTSEKMKLDADLSYEETLSDDDNKQTERSREEMERLQEFLSLESACQALSPNPMEYNSSAVENIDEFQESGRGSFKNQEKAEEGTQKMTPRPSEGQAYTPGLSQTPAFDLNLMSSEEQYQHSGLLDVPMSPIHEESAEYEEETMWKKNEKSKKKSGTPSPKKSTGKTGSKQNVKGKPPTGKSPEKSSSTSSTKKDIEQDPNKTGESKSKMRDSEIVSAELGFVGDHFDKKYNKGSPIKERQNKVETEQEQTLMKPTHETQPKTVIEEDVITPNQIQQEESEAVFDFERLDQEKGEHSPRHQQKQRDQRDDKESRIFEFKKVDKDKGELEEKHTAFDKKSKQESEGPKMDTSMHSKDKQTKPHDLNQKSGSDESSQFEEKSKPSSPWGFFGGAVGRFLGKLKPKQPLNEDVEQQQQQRQDKQSSTTTEGKESLGSQQESNIPRKVTSDELQMEKNQTESQQQIAGKDSKESQLNEKSEQGTVKPQSKDKRTDKHDLADEETILSQSVNADENTPVVFSKDESASKSDHRQLVRPKPVDEAKIVSNKVSKNETTPSIIDQEKSSNIEGRSKKSTRGKDSRPKLLDEDEIISKTVNKDETASDMLEEQNQQSEPGIEKQRSEQRSSSSNKLIQGHHRSISRDKQSGNAKRSRKEVSANNTEKHLPKEIPSKTTLVQERLLTMKRTPEQRPNESRAPHKKRDENSADRFDDNNNQNTTQPLKQKQSQSPAQSPLVERGRPGSGHSRIPTPRSRNNSPLHSPSLENKRSPVESPLVQRRRREENRSRSDSKTSETSPVKQNTNCGARATASPMGRGRSPTKTSTTHGQTSKPTVDTPGKSTQQVGDTDLRKQRVSPYKQGKISRSQDVECSQEGPKESRQDREGYISPDVDSLDSRRSSNSDRVKEESDEKQQKESINRNGSRTKIAQIAKPKKRQSKPSEAPPKRIVCYYPSNQGTQIPHGHTEYVRQNSVSSVDSLFSVSSVATGGEEHSKYETKKFGPHRVRSEQEGDRKNQQPKEKQHHSDKTTMRKAPKADMFEKEKALSSGQNSAKPTTKKNPELGTTDERQRYLDEMVLKTGKKKTQTKGIVKSNTPGFIEYAMECPKECKKKEYPLKVSPKVMDSPSRSIVTQEPSTDVVQPTSPFKRRHKDLYAHVESPTKKLMYRNVKSATKDESKDGTAPRQSSPKKTKCLGESPAKRREPKTTTKGTSSKQLYDDVKVPYVSPYKQSELKKSKKEKDHPHHTCSYNPEKEDQSFLFGMEDQWKSGSNKNRIPRSKSKNSPLSYKGALNSQFGVGDLLGHPHDENAQISTDIERQNEEQTTLSRPEETRKQKPLMESKKYQMADEKEEEKRRKNVEKQMKQDKYQTKLRERYSKEELDQPTPKKQVRLTQSYPAYPEVVQRHEDNPQNKMLGYRCVQGQDDGVSTRLTQSLDIERNKFNQMAAKREDSERPYPGLSTSYDHLNFNYHSPFYRSRSTPNQLHGSKNIQQFSRSFDGREVQQMWSPNDYYGYVETRGRTLPDIGHIERIDEYHHAHVQDKELILPELPQERSYRLQAPYATEQHPLAYQKLYFRGKIEGDDKQDPAYIEGYLEKDSSKSENDTNNTENIEAAEEYLKTFFGEMGFPETQNQKQRKEPRNKSELVVEDDIVPVHETLDADKGNREYQKNVFDDDNNNRDEEQEIRKQKYLEEEKLRKGNQNVREFPPPSKVTPLQGAEKQMPRSPVHPTGRPYYLEMQQDNYVPRSKVIPLLDDQTTKYTDQKDDSKQEDDQDKPSKQPETCEVLDRDTRTQEPLMWRIPETYKLPSVVVGRSHERYIPSIYNGEPYMQSYIQNTPKKLIKGGIVPAYNFFPIICSSHLPKKVLHPLDMRDLSNKGKTKTRSKSKSPERTTPLNKDLAKRSRSHSPNHANRSAEESCKRKRQDSMQKPIDEDTLRQNKKKLKNMQTKKKSIQQKPYSLATHARVKSPRMVLREEDWEHGNRSNTLFATNDFGIVPRESRESSTLQREKTKESSILEREEKIDTTKHEASSRDEQMFIVGGFTYSSPSKSSDQRQSQNREAQQQKPKIKKTIKGGKINKKSTKFSNKNKQKKKEKSSKLKKSDQEGLKIQQTIQENNDKIAEIAFFESVSQVESNTKTLEEELREISMSDSRERITQSSSQTHTLPPRAVVQYVEHGFPPYPNIASDEQQYSCNKSCENEVSIEESMQDPTSIKTDQHLIQLITDEIEKLEKAGDVYEEHPPSCGFTSNKNSNKLMYETSTKDVDQSEIYVTKQKTSNQYFDGVLGVSNLTRYEKTTKKELEEKYKQNTTKATPIIRKEKVLRSKNELAASATAKQKASQRSVQRRTKDDSYDSFEHHEKYFGILDEQGKVRNNKQLLDKGYTDKKFQSKIRKKQRRNERLQKDLESAKHPRRFSCPPTVGAREGILSFSDDTISSEANTLESIDENKRDINISETKNDTEEKTIIKQSQNLATTETTQSTFKTKQVNTGGFGYEEETYHYIDERQLKKKQEQYDDRLMSFDIPIVTSESQKIDDNDLTSGSDDNVRSRSDTTDTENSGNCSDRDCMKPLTSIYTTSSLRSRSEDRYCYTPTSYRQSYYSGFTSTYSPRRSAIPRWRNYDYYN